MIQGVIKICRSKDPAGLAQKGISNVGSNPDDNWILDVTPIKGTREKELDWISLPNCYHRTETRRSLGDFVKPPPDRITWRNKAEVARVKCTTLKFRI